MRTLGLAFALLFATLTAAIQPAWAAPHGRTVLTGVVNLNQADPATLKLLPGIGETRAKAIVEWRRGHAFKKTEDLSRVKGIGRKTMARLRPYLTLAGASTLHRNQDERPRAASSAK